MFCSQPKHFTVAIAMFLVVGIMGSAQTRPPMTVPQSDGDIIIPTTTGILSQRDPVALAEFANHLAAVGSIPWKGMQGNGTIVYGSQDATPYTATLSNLGADRFRLDADSKHGATSIRVHGRLGKLQDSDGTLVPMFSETASLLIFPFELVRLASLPGKEESVIDRGLTNVGGLQLHRVTFERPSFGLNPVTKSPATVAIDFYFDPTTHLLIKSALSTRIPDGRDAKFLFVVTYSDYRLVGSTLVPFLYTETMEGQPYWKLQLSNVQLNPGLASNYFDF